ncbi:MAG: hypothetical protein Kow0074_10230 [Candidatus Zixiibacteriota bacterium]
MRMFEKLYSIARVLVVALFLAGTATAVLFGPKTMWAKALFVTGVLILGMTPIFGLAIAGTTWLRRNSTDTVGWAAVLLALFATYLWLGI